MNLINLEYKKDIITVDLRNKQIRYLTNLHKLGNLKFVDMSNKFKLLLFELRYFECGMQFNGLLEVSKGKILTDKTGDYFGNRGG